MTGLILLSYDGFYADSAGNIIKGPKADKQWLLRKITGKRVLIGWKTWESIKNYKKLISAPDFWSIGKLHGYCDYNFGGPKTFAKYPPDKIIVHRTYFNQETGLKFEGLRDYVLVSWKTYGSYKEEIYEKRWKRNRKDI